MPRVSMSRNISLYGVLGSVAFLTLFYFSVKVDYNEDGDNYFSILNSKSGQDFQNGSYIGPIRLAIVVCSKPGDNGPRQETELFIKSVVISSMVYGTTNDIEIHIFNEHVEDEEYFESKLKEFDNPLSKAKKTLYFHSAAEIVDNYYQSNMTNEERLRCMYVRMFFPSVLEDLDSVIYLDSDNLITGDLNDLWAYFYQMKEELLVGMIPDYTAENPRKPDFFKEIPFIGPKGLNSGVQLMNLTKMREYGWEEKLLRIYDDYAIRQQIRMRSDQKLINILLYFDSGLLFTLPCQYNFWRGHCDKGFYCDGAVKDPKGIQVLHGAGNSNRKGGVYFEIFVYYRRLQLNRNSSLEQLKSDLMEPIRVEYSPSLRNKQHKKRSAKRGECETWIGKLIFKDQFN